MITIKYLEEHPELWQQVFYPHRHYGHISTSREAALKAEYPFFIWNEVLYISITAGLVKEESLSPFLVKDAPSKLEVLINQLSGNPNILGWHLAPTGKVDIRHKFKLNASVKYVSSTGKETTTLFKSVCATEFYKELLSDMKGGEASGSTTPSHWYHYNSEVCPLPNNRTHVKITESLGSSLSTLREITGVGWSDSFPITANFPSLEEWVASVKVWLEV